MSVVLSVLVLDIFFSSFLFLLNYPSFRQRKTAVDIIIIIIINLLTARVVGAPQMTLQPVFSIFHVLHCPLGLTELQACPFPDVVLPHLPLSALSSSPFHCALQDGFGQTR